MAEIFIVHSKFCFKFVFHHQCYFFPQNSLQLALSVICPVILHTDWCVEYLWRMSRALISQFPIGICGWKKITTPCWKMQTYYHRQKCWRIFSFASPFKDSLETPGPPFPSVQISKQQEQQARKLKTDSGRWIGKENQSPRIGLKRL